ncbi:MAG TPA: glutamine amidotransferase [Clostridiaceae bacterium]|nr:glutamine amidotransferase [Clostridiaceae bacterium]
MKLRLAHFYPDLLNFYEDDGNVFILQEKAEQMGIDFEVTNISAGDAFDPLAFDLLFMGGGKDGDQRKVSPDLVKNKKANLIKAIEAGVPMLCICGGYQLMGKRYLDSTGFEIEGLGILNLETIAHPERLVGSLEFETTLDLQNKILIGVENHGGRTYYCSESGSANDSEFQFSPGLKSTACSSPGSGCGSQLKPFGRVIKGYGNNGDDGTEGAIYKNLIGTYAHGSFLPKNPQMADYLLNLAIERRGLQIKDK